MDGHVEVTACVLRPEPGHALPAQPEDAPVGRSWRDRQRQGSPVWGGHARLTAEEKCLEGSADLGVQVVPAALEARIKGSTVTTR